MSKKLAVHFSDQFPGVIWGLHIDNDHLLICCRDDTIAQLSFSLLDLAKCKYLWKELTFDGLSWVGVTHFYKDVIVFHQYKDSQDIESKSWFGFNIHSMEVLWQEEDMKAGYFEGQWYVFKGHGDDRQPFLRDIRTEVVSKTDLKDIQRLKITEEVPKLTVYPFHYLEEGEDFKKVAFFILKKLMHVAFGACDYMEFRDKVIISFYHQEEGKVVNQLVVFDGQGEVVFSKKIGTGLKGLGMDTFFVNREQLIFVDHKTKICSYLLG